MGTKRHNDTWFYTDEDYDYSKEIQKAVDEGDFQKAAHLEKSRNAKIDYYGMPYEMTYDYQDYLPSIGKSGAVGESAVPSGKGGKAGSYGDSMNIIMNNIQGKKFSYTPKSDPLYKQIKSNYEKTAGDVIENTMGTFAGMTGGVPSSYATSAAATAGAQHLQNADDIIPELYELAYNKFADDKADLYKQYGIMQGLEEQEYNRGVYDEEKAYTRQQEALKAQADAEKEALENERWWAEFYAEQAGEEYDRMTDSQKYYAGLITDMVEKGSVPEDYMMALAGINNISGQQFYDNYINEYNRQLSEKNKYKGSSEGSAKDKELKYPSAAMTEIDKLFEAGGEGAEGLSKVIGKYDPKEYDMDSLENYIQKHYGNEDGVNEYLQRVSIGAKSIADSINADYSDDFGNGGNAPIIDNGDGTYAVNRNAAMRVIDTIANDKRLSDDEKIEMLITFGIGQDLIDEYNRNDNY